MTKIFAICSYFFGISIVLIIAFAIILRFENADLTETQLFLKFWYMIPISIICFAFFVFTSYKLDQMLTSNRKSFFSSKKEDEIVKPYLANKDRQYGEIEHPTKTVSNQELADFIETLCFKLQMNIAHDWDGIESDSDVELYKEAVLKNVDRYTILRQTTIVNNF